MKNTIQFYRFKNSNSSFSENLLNEQKNSIENLNSSIISKKEFLEFIRSDQSVSWETNGEIHDILMAIVEEEFNRRIFNEPKEKKQIDLKVVIEEVRRSKYEFRYSGVREFSDKYQKIVKSYGIDRNSSELIYDIFRKIVDNNKTKYFFDLLEIDKPIEEEISDIERSIMDMKSKIREIENTFHERIEIKDMEALNQEIEEMNKDGWTIKHIEGVQSGKYDHHHEIQYGSMDRGGAGYGFGYGYSFTEGVLIVWEKDD